MYTSTLAGLGSLQGDMGDYPGAAASLTQALALYGAAGDLPGQGGPNPNDVASIMLRRFRFRGFSGGAELLGCRCGVSYRCMPSKSAQNSRVDQARYGSIHRTC